MTWTPRILFRSLIGLALVVGALYGYGFSTIEHYPESWQETPDIRKLATWALFALGPILAILHVVAYVGLFLFWGPARTLAVLYLVGSVLTVAFMDYPQTPGWVEALDRLDLALLGIIIGVMYLPPFGQLFMPRARSNNTIEGDARKSGARPSL